MANPARSRRGALALVLGGLILVALGAALLASRLVPPAVLDEGELAGTVAVEPELEPTEPGPPERDAAVRAEAGPAAPDAGPDAEPAPGGDDRQGPAREGGGRAAGGATAPAGSHIVALGPRTFKVSRAWLDEALRTGKGLGGARAQPATANGALVGFELTGVSGGDLARLGLRDGDVITRVNGRSIASPDVALDAYRRNVRSRKMVLTVRRGGSPVSLEYRIE